MSFAALLHLGCIMGLAYSLWLSPTTCRTAKKHAWSMARCSSAAPTPALQMSSQSSQSFSNSSSSVPTSLAKKKSKKLYSFTEARKIARGHGFHSHQEFVEYTCPGVYQLPKNAEEVWHAEWTSWEDFLGIPLPFDQGRRVARQLNFTTAEEYMHWMEGNIIPEDSLASRLPYRPDLLYHQDEWQGWDDWLMG
jgi:hypothetical protein